MALRHAVLAALLDEELSGYQLAKAFAAGVANFWHAKPQQVYAELAKLERDGLASGRRVAQEGRPDKRLFCVTAAGLAELERFASTTAAPSFLREDLLVQVQAADHLDTDVLIDRLTERYACAEAKAALFEAQLRAMRGESDEAEFLLRGARVGPYLTCRRGRDFERANRDWCREVVEVLRARRKARSGG
ncbi:PadR family transcriptional regulator [Streptomyces sp. NPDC017448]|uniref:PadR family transcriptional regulator n=1 Tax=Streptomyces sp. NPDC017448 TaxID=3364996 RepID=UPI0037B22557